MTILRIMGLLFYVGTTFRPLKEVVIPHLMRDLPNFSLEKSRAQQCYQRKYMTNKAFEYYLRARDSTYGEIREIPHQVRDDEIENFVAQM